MATIGLLYCAAIWGATFVIVKDALADVSAVPMVAYRFAIAAACLLPWVWRRGLGRLWREGFILSLILLVLYVGQTAGLAWTSASNGAFISGLFVVFVPIFQLAFSGRPLPGPEALAVALALAGLWLVTGGLAGITRGDTLSLIAAATYAGHVLFTDKFIREDADILVLAFHQFWMTSALAFAACGLWHLPMAVAGPKAWGVIAFLAILPTMSAFVVQMLIQKKLSPMSVSLGFSLEPVFAALFAWTWGGEPFSARKAVGGLCIVAAMAAVPGLAYLSGLLRFSTPRVWSLRNRSSEPR
jgi:drug/metabolite transporter (DMT)-like permease